MVQSGGGTAQHVRHGTAGLMEVIRAETAQQLAECLLIRRVVFIEEQNVPEDEEVDGKDDVCLHYLLRSNRTSIGTARVSVMGDTAKIQRVAILKDYRMGGTGSILMRYVLNDLRSESEVKKATLGSQTHAIRFYERLGFVAHGPEFDDAGIPHREMTLAL